MNTSYDDDFADALIKFERAKKAALATLSAHYGRSACEAVSEAVAQLVRNHLEYFVLRSEGDLGVVADVIEEMF